LNVYLLFILILTASLGLAQDIPLPEHPRPDWNRPGWENLNGEWNFRLDSADAGIARNWQDHPQDFDRSITVPFPWGSPLSGVADGADVGWYHRSIRVSRDWADRCTFLVVGAADWETTVWLDGTLVGTHRGGYLPFEFDLTPYLRYGTDQHLVLRVDDKLRWRALRGKQHYGNVRGIWQTPYLEARGERHLKFLHFTPDLATSTVGVHARLDSHLVAPDTLFLVVETPGGRVEVKKEIRRVKDMGKFTFALPAPRLWTLDDPYLYPVTARFGNDTVHTYFGMRKISVTDLPGTNYPYVALNGKPVYLQLALDQAYHPEGYYTFPSDSFLRTELERARALGLNGLRPHLKIALPRKLYWADKLGLLIMADVPNTKNDASEDMELEVEYALRGMIERDYNHPSIFSWVLFNESWGLNEQVITDSSQYMSLTPASHLRAAALYYLTKSLDPTRLVDDNSIHSYQHAEHTITDLNSSHDYLTGQQWDARLRRRTEYSYPGSTFQYAEGFAQRPNTPTINAESGNVWGYSGTASDVDWSWDYHRMVNTFRTYPEMAGWVYTELHDVVKEWNGYWKYNRSPKYSGLGELVPGMHIPDFHSPVYLSTGNEISRTVTAGDSVLIPLWLSVMTDTDYGDRLTADYELAFTDRVGNRELLTTGSFPVPYRPYLQRELPPLRLTAPDRPGLAIVRFFLRAPSGEVVHRNFFHLEITGGEVLDGQIELPADDFSASDWSEKQWSVLGGKKVNGAGSGYFTYAFDLPASEKAPTGKELYFLAELSGRPLLVKDMSDAQKRARGIELNTHRKYPDDNPNAYPMTDDVRKPSRVIIAANGTPIDTVHLPDDPADHRGILSWHHQDLPPVDYDTWNADNWGGIERNYHLREAGTYGYLTQVRIPSEIWRPALREGRALEVTLAVDEPTGLAVYGAEFGRYPVPVSLVWE
jgi:hypothetical protein